MKLSMVMLGVENLEKSVAFYRDVVGVLPKNQIEQFAFLEAGDVTLVLSQPLGQRVQPRAGAVQVIFAAASVRKAHQELYGRGAHFLGDPSEVSPGAWAATFKDPDGHMLSIYGPE
jgi:catechol 2,3-dioxygenase-like lactoylglutathione lyase family enzyme